MSEKCGAKCEVYSRCCGYFRPVTNWNKGKQEEFRERKHFKVTGVLLALLAALLLPTLTGCEAVKSVTDSTREKSIAAGSDTWGGGVEAKTATADCPVPGFECWFGRRKVWYASVRDRATGQAAAEIVRASNSPLSVSADSTITASGNRWWTRRCWIKGKGGNGK